MMTTSSSSNPPEEDTWFHEDINREEAEELLKNDGEEGAFLIRKSTSSLGDYVLSLLSGGCIVHIHVYRHYNDAFFSIEENNVIHGLDELVKQYLSSTDSSISLVKSLGKSQLPPDTRLHGRTNLLHRATKGGDSNIVLELVRTRSYRSLDAKNEDGQTAAHLAATNGDAHILSILIEAGCNVNAKDSGDCTPLHYACSYNHPSVVSILCTKGGANPQIRRNQDGWVPLHEAAAKGFTECVQILLENGAPVLPRTSDHKFPIDLAEENSHSTSITFLRNYIVPKAKSNSSDWYHSHLERSDAVELLFQCQAYHDNDTSTCYFLVRRSAKTATKVIVLTLLWAGHPYHFEISRDKDGGYYHIDDGPHLPSLDHVVEHYSKWADGLPARLQTPVHPLQSFGTSNTFSPSTTTIPSSLVPPPLPARIPSCSPKFVRSGGVNLNDILNNNSGFTKENIPASWLEIGGRIGEGEYGEVYDGIMRIPHGRGELEVAIKSLREELRETTRNEFLREARNMMDLDHENIVKIIGISWEPQIYMIQELLKLGSLQDYLIVNRDSVIPDKDIPRWVTHIAKGMLYLQEKRFVHRDLASRNILLASKQVAKISDFGLSRALGMDSNYYAASNGGKWPIKWYAPESCAYGRFTHASDIWSFGVMLWECYSYGDTPYGELQGTEVIDLVERGVRLERPQDCPDSVYQVMKKCWEKEPEKRPTFEFLRDFFQSKIM